MPSRIAASIGRRSGVKFGSRLTVDQRIEAEVRAERSLSGISTAHPLPNTSRTWAPNTFRTWAPRWERREAPVREGNTAKRRPLPRDASTAGFRARAHAGSPRRKPGTHWRARTGRGVPFGRVPGWRQDQALSLHLPPPAFPGEEAKAGR